VVVDVEPNPVDEVAFVKVQHLTDFADAQFHGFSRHLFVFELAFQEGTGGQRAIVLRRHLCCFFFVWVFYFFSSFAILFGNHRTNATQEGSACGHGAVQRIVLHAQACDGAE
jgi:hypothetical protein